MAWLSLSGVSVELPIYHASARSMRRSALQGALGRKVSVEGQRATVAALTDIDLELEDGARLALLGPNGAGKSILLRTLAGVYTPVRGRVRRTGKLTPLLSHGIGLDLNATGLENIFLLGMHLDLPPKDMRQRVEEIVEWTELGPFIAAPVRTYSAGMIMRLAFAVSTCAPADILLIDEWIGVVDAEFQEKAHARMAAFVGGTRILVLASHYQELVRLWCREAVRLEGGRIVARGTVEEILPAPMPDV
jgi:ABC-2 type transport system ATP-binding protein/lipopolysaccharide transport system ATP-binding protein